jgi:hypothetical protein
LDAITVPAPIMKHATVVRALLIYFAKFVRNVRRLKKKELTH